MRLLVTGGCGFIGSALVRRAVAEGHTVVNLDILSYAANLRNVAIVADNPAYHFEQADICDETALNRIFNEHHPEAVMHLAAETHVDSSIDRPASFVETNITGTSTLLEAARHYWEHRGRPRDFRFLHVSTDEVYGSLGPDDDHFTEASPYDPRSPYAASKAAADHLVSAWSATYGLPVILTNCSNNYGTFQFPEKLIPVVIVSAMSGLPIPVYGDGMNVRDWIHVEDHVAALLAAVENAKPASKYLIGAENEVTNLDLVHRICACLDVLRPAGTPHSRLIDFVTDRPGHDWRYALDPSLIRDELGWQAQTDFDEGLMQTVTWYLENEAWWRPLLNDQNPASRRGIA